MTMANQSGDLVSGNYLKMGKKKVKIDLEKITHLQPI